jgi:hypothetical protein
MRNHADLVDHPKHYNTGSIEVIDFIEDQRLSFHLGNVVKYICRAPHKEDADGDLRKALWYLQRAVDMQVLGKPKTIGRIPEEGPKNA